MQLSIISAQEALATLFESWLRLQNDCNSGADNSNSYLRLADEIQANPDSELRVLCVHDGDPKRELHALCIVETQRSWIASKRTLANWITEPGLDSTPLCAQEQRFSALHTILRDLPSIDASAFLSLRHLQAQSSSLVALQAICEQQLLSMQVCSERRNSMCELKIRLKSNEGINNHPLNTAHFESSRSLP